MLPSMPILFSRDSQEAFESKIQPSTSFFSQHPSPKLLIPKVVPEAPKEVPKQAEVKNKTESEKKKNDPPNVDDNTLENAFVRSYYHRVQSRFSSNSSVPTNKFVQFQNILRNFNPNNETPVQLYKKVENLFGAEHKDIVEDFLLFLKPGQAVEVGRFTDRFQLVQMTGFINMLHSTFARKPTVLRKVLRALTTALNSGTTDEAKTRVLPHFRAHPRLAAAFRALLPDERPPDSLYESGVDMANESFLTDDRGHDVWDFEDETENKRKLGAKEGLDTIYMNGRVFLQHGRLLRSARVTFPYSKEPYRVHARRLAPSPHPTPPDSDEETPQKEPPKSKLPPKRTRKQNKSPTKKDVNDNTKNNCQVSQLSPKPKKSQKTKNGKKELDNVPKKSKSAAKKDIDAPKAKQARVEASEAKLDAPVKADVKPEPLLKFEPKLDVTLKNELPVTVEPSANAQANIDASVSVEMKKIEVKNNNWTRDEDKTMLQVLKGEAGSEKVFGKIRELLPHRSAAEIKERFCHVMTLLQQMAVSEVT